MCLEMLLFYRWPFLIQVFIVFIKMTLAQESNSIENNQVKISFNKLLKNIILVNEKRIKAIKQLAHLQDIDVHTRDKYNWLNDADSQEDSTKEDSKNNDDNDIVAVFDVRDALVRKKSAKSDEDSYSNNEFAPKQFVMLVRKTRDTNNIRDANNNIALDTNNVIDTNNIDINNEIDTSDVRDSGDAKDTIDTIDANVLDTIGIIDTDYNIDINDALEANFVKDINYVMDTNDASIQRRSWHDGCNRKAAKLCTKACKKAHKRSCKTYKCTSSKNRLIKKECKIYCKMHFENDRNTEEE